MRKWGRTEHGELGVNVAGADDAILLNVHEAAKFLRVSETSIRRWSDSGKLKCYRVGEAKHRRFALDDLKEYLERGGE